MEPGLRIWNQLKSSQQNWQPTEPLQTKFLQL